MDRDDPAYAGQASFTRTALRLYDPFILGLSMRLVWRCPTARLVEGYRQHIGDPHLDVGPGTGYFLDHAGLPDGSRVTLLDPNPNVLAHASARLGELDVTTVEADVLKPLPVVGPFASAAMDLVLHCLPGPPERKAQAVSNIAAVLAPDGVFFGATVLGTSGDHNRMAHRMLDFYGRRGAFDNDGDSEPWLRETLEGSFREVQVETVHSIAIFTATGPRGSARPPAEARR
jgi:SAM-dependent methyltransferase